MINSIIRYFDLQSAKRDAAVGQSGERSAKSAPVVPQYLALVAGVIADPFLRAFEATGTFGDVWPTLAYRTIFAGLIAVAILPAVYKRAFDPDRPVLVQLAALFVSGLGWQSLFQAALKVGAKAPGL